MKLSDYLADKLAEEGIHHVFQIIGGASVHMVHSISQHKDLSYICVQHEQAGAMAAEAYARVTKNMGAAMATSGPGMTNLITGIACAYFDSIPVLYITGQVNTFESKQGRNVRQIGFQETDIAEMVRPITKFSVRIEDPNDIRYILEKLFYIARAGRQGPVLLDVPMDIQRAEIEPEKLRRFDPKELKDEVDLKAELNEKIKKSFTIIKNSERPVVIAGGGIRYADQINEFRKLVHTLKIPVVSTWSGIDTIDHDDPFYIGQIGVYGNRAANFTVQNSDCIISFGSRLDTRITGGKPETFAREAKKIVIDIDRDELYKKRGLDPDIGICADVKDVIPLFTKAFRTNKKISIPEWIEKTKKWKKDYPSVLPGWRKRKNRVDPYMFMETLSGILDKNATIVTDCGANLTWTIQAFHVHKGQRLFSAMGNSPMGYSISAGIGASIGLGRKPVVCIIGDGGLQMNLQELQTVVYYKLPLKIFIINNHSYGIIKQFQDQYFGGNYEGTTPETGYSVPNFIKISNAYGIKSETINNHQELKRKIQTVLREKGPVICDVIIPDGSKLIPKVEFGKPIEDQSPLLPRQEFLKNMIVKVIS